MPRYGYPKLFLTLVIMFLLGAPAAAQAWQVTLHVHGAGMVTETTDAHLMHCTVFADGSTSESDVTDCFGGSTSGPYASGWIVNLNAAVDVGSTAYNRGWRFQKWVDGTASKQINCDPQNVTGDHTSADCQFQIFDNLYADVYFDDTFANPVDSLTGTPAAGSRVNSTSASFGFNASGDPDSDYQCRLEKPAPDTTLDWYDCGSPFDKAESYSALTTNGAYTFRVRSVDPSGNLGAFQSRSWTVDTVAPTVAIGGSPSNGATTNSTSAGFTLTPSETATVQCKLDRPGIPGTFASCGSTQNYNGLTDGTYTFSARAVDGANNTGSATTRTWTVDATPPDTSISSGPSGPTNSASASFDFSATGGAVSYECQLSPGGSWEPCTSGKTYSALTPGTYVFSVRGIDSTGNVEGTPATRTFTLDQQPPDTSIDSGPSGETNSTGATFGFAATESNVSFECKLDGGPWESCASGKTYSSLAPGSHTFYVRGTDQAGNVEASEASRTWTISVPPVTPGGTPGGTPSGGAPDTAGPVAVLTFSTQRLARVLRRGLGGSGSTTEPGTLVLDVLYRGKKVATSGKRALTKAGALKLIARFTTKGRRTLGRMRAARVTLRLTATDAAGNVTIKKKTVTLKRLRAGRARRPRSPRVRGLRFRPRRTDRARSGTRPRARCCRDGQRPPVRGRTPRCRAPASGTSSRCGPPDRRRSAPRPFRTEDRSRRGRREHDRGPRPTRRVRVRPSSRTRSCTSAAAGPPPACPRCRGRRTSA